jgi:hypothetical protein
MISERYRKFINAMRSRNGLPSPFPAHGQQPPTAPIDADEGNDGLETLDPDEQLELMRKTIADINGENEDDAGGGRPDDNEVDEFSALGALALPTRKLMVAHYRAKLAEPPADERRAKAVKDMAAFILRCHKKAGW